MEIQRIFIKISKAQKRYERHRQVNPMLPLQQLWLMLKDVLPELLDPIIKGGRQHNATQNKYKW